MKGKHPTEAEIRQRAYEIFLAHGSRPGHDMDNWLQAEYELTRMPTDKNPKHPSPKARKHNGGTLVKIA